MTPLFKKIHLWLSLPFGILFSVTCLTGAMLVFEKEITRAVTHETAQYEVRQESAAPHGGHGEAAAAVQKPTNKHGQRLPFFQTVLKIHRWLLDAPKNRGEITAGKVIVGISTLMMVFVLISGIVIWVPKNAAQLKNRLKVSLHKGWPRFIYDSHVSLGIYVAIFLLIMAITGLTWSSPLFRKGFVALFEGVVGADNMRGFIYSLHTGSWGGIVTKIIYFICALIGGLLPWTGYYLWIKKLKKH